MKNPFLDSERAVPRGDIARPAVGPSDSSDSPSDLPAGADSDTDAQGTGERDSVNQRRGGQPADVAPDDIVDADEAGVSRSPADPARNGGQPG